MSLRRLAALAVALCACRVAVAQPTLTHQIELPQVSDFCNFGTFSPSTGLERIVLGPPAGVQITKTRLVITFVTSDACEPTFDAGNLLLKLINANTEWIVAGSVELGWAGQGTFTATIETDIFNGPNPSRLWEDAYHATIETQIPGHFHEDVEFVDSYWEFDFIDPNILLGDANCDGFLTFDDLDAFVLGLLDEFAYFEMHPFCSLSVLDMNSDGFNDGLDIAGFIDALLNAPPAGACCLPGGDCRTMTEADCTAPGTDGVYQGDQSGCGEECPISQPEIDFTTLPAQIDNCNATHAQFDVFGSGFNSDAFVEFIKADEDPVQVFAGATDHTFITTFDFETECLTAAGFWDLRITNPDGGTVTLPNAIEITACPQAPHTVDSVVFSPAVLETCPGTTPVNPSIQVSATITGTNLPNEFFVQTLFAQTVVHLEDTTTGEPYFTFFVGDLVQQTPTEFSLEFSVFQGNVFFPHSSPPPGEYRLVVETCSQRIETAATLQIMPADPGMCPEPP